MHEWDKKEKYNEFLTGLKLQCLAKLQYTKSEYWYGDNVDIECPTLLQIPLYIGHLFWEHMSTMDRFYSIINPHRYLTLCTRLLIHEPMVFTQVIRSCWSWEQPWGLGNQIYCLALELIMSIVFHHKTLGLVRNYSYALYANFICDQNCRNFCFLLQNCSF